MAAMAQGISPKSGGVAMTADTDIVRNVWSSTLQTTVVAAVQAAGLVETLSGAGSFTVFAPTDDAFAVLRAWIATTLLLPENEAQL